MANKYLVLDFDDPKIKHLADVLGNKKCKKILEYLADSEASETEIARDLKMPANTVNYNVKKLLYSGLIEKSKDFFWSVKGKKVLKYRVANKKILISPKNQTLTRNFFVSGLILGAGALLIKIYSGSATVVSEGVAKSDFLERAAEASVQAGGVATIIQSNVWAWFLFGGLSALLIYMILNYRRL